ncbi:MAG: DUF1292 domain-containing protein [Lachnospiraceae bacterium]|nr:DUF1292 domain-containing protein [Lachnospiraceae bacterium]
MAEKDEIIKFTGDSGDEVEFRVVEQTKLNGSTYLLVLNTTEGEEDEALILKEISTDDKNEITYEILEDDDELNAIAGVFEGLLEDIQLV